MNIGDLVYLKSGSPKMTVVGEDASGARICGWCVYDTGIYHTAVLPEAALVPASEKNKLYSRGNFDDEIPV